MFTRDVQNRGPDVLARTLEGQMSGNALAGGPGRGQSQAEVSQEYAAFKIEQRGIDLIPDSDRKMRPSGLFWLWHPGSTSLSPITCCAAASTIRPPCSPPAAACTGATAASTGPPSSPRWSAWSPP